MTKLSLILFLLKLKCKFWLDNPENLISAKAATLVLTVITWWPWLMNIREADAWLVVVVHVIQLITGLMAIVIGYFTLKKEFKNRKENPEG